MTRKLARYKSINILLILSIVGAFFIIPTPANAGMLGSFLRAIRPFATVAGKIAGAVAGASLCAGFLPPLGLLAGGIAGWIVGGIVTGYATGSLTNLATLGGAIGGAMALASFGPLGYIGGVMLGGFLARKAMGLLYQADRATTGGMVFLTDGSKSTAANQKSSGGSVALAPEIPPAYEGEGKTVFIQESSETNVIAPNPISMEERIREADAKYQAAYTAYINATKENKAANLKDAHKAYKEAYDAYKKLTGKEPTYK